MYTREGFRTIVAVILAISGLVAAQDDENNYPELVVLPAGETHTKPIDGAILFTCTAINVNQDTQVNLKWLNKENNEITDTTGRMYVEKVEETILKLYITSIQNQDAGMYTCTGELSGLVEKTVNLEIFKDITFDHAPSPQHPAKFTKALIECRVSGRPTPAVSWRYRGQTLPSSGRYLITPEGLEIDNATKEDDGTYKCRGEVSADGRMKERDIQVIVYTPPTITDPIGDSQQGIEGQEVSLECGAFGDPMPKYEFYRINGESETPVVPDEERVEIDRDAGRVHYRPIIKGDEGEYKCKAFNEVGEAISVGTLTVIVPPKIHTLINQTAIEGQSQTLTCISDGDPAPQMTFRKMGNGYEYEMGENEGGKVVVVSPMAGTLEMTVKNLVPDDTDNYTCKAVNEAGDHKVNGTLIVHYTPRFPEDHKVEYFLWAGKTRNITCNSHSEPEPVIRWYKDGRELVNNETYKIYPMKKNSNLQITCREEDQSWIYDVYTCDVTNNIGTGTIDVQVLRARLPSAPQGATVKTKSPTMVVLDVEPPLDNGGIPITGYRVEYDTTSNQDYALGVPVMIENLRPGTTYIFKIKAKNEVGVGNGLDFSHTTEVVRNPYPIVMKLNEAVFPYSYELQWERPRTGGLPIEEYEFKYRKVLLHGNGQGGIKEPLEGWIRTLREDDPQAPMTSYNLEGLAAQTSYQVDVRARNQIAWSDSVKPNFTFTTQQDPDMPAPFDSSPGPDSDDNGGDPKVGQTRAGLGAKAVVGIVIVVFVIFLIIVDVSCYFMNGCGILMCICVNLCGKPQPVSKEKAMEEGESKEALKQPVDDAIVAQEQEVVSEEPPQKEEAAENQPDDPPAAAQDDDEKKPVSEGGEMEELEPEDKEEKTDPVIEDQVPEPPPALVEPPQEEEVEVEPDEKTPLNTEDPKPTEEVATEEQPQEPPSDQEQLKPEQA